MNELGEETRKISSFSGREKCEEENHVWKVWGPSFSASAFEKTSSRVSSFSLINNLSTMLTGLFIGAYPCMANISIMAGLGLFIGRLLYNTLICCILCLLWQALVRFVLFAAFGGLPCRESFRYKQVINTCISL